MQWVNLNTEKANYGCLSARRMYGNSAEISILKPQKTDFCFMEAHSSTILSSHPSVRVPCGIKYDFQKLIKNGKSRIFLFFRQVCWAEMPCDCICPLFCCVKTRNVSPHTFL